MVCIGNASETPVAQMAGPGVRFHTIGPSGVDEAESVAVKQERRRIKKLERELHREDWLKRPPCLSHAIFHGVTLAE